MKKQYAPRDVLEISPEWEQFRRSNRLTTNELIFVRSHDPWSLEEDVVEVMAYELEEALRKHRWQDAASYLAILVQSDVEENIPTLMKFEMGPLLQLGHLRG